VLASSARDDSAGRKPVSKLAPPAIEQVAVASLTLYPTFGRDIKQHRLAKLRRAWEPAAMGAITISERPDGTRLVIEGNHRVTVAREKGDPLVVNALVHRGLTEAQEAELYSKLNDVLAQAPMDIFRSNLAADNPMAKSVLAQVEDAGYHLAGLSGAKITGLQCIGTLNGIAALYNVPHIHTTLTFCKNAFGPGARLHGYAVMAVASILWVYKDKLDVARMEAAATSIGAVRLKAWASNTSIEKQISKDAAYATLLVDTYNRGLPKGVRSRRLKVWAEASGGKVKNERDVRKSAQRAVHEAVWNERIKEADDRPS
jgi:hypothetical protein